MTHPIVSSLLRSGRSGAALLTAALLTVALLPAALAAELHPCAEATSRCDGQIQVPLNWDDPASGPITIAFAWIPRSDQSQPATGTVMANPGGPAPALPWVPTLQFVLGPVLQRQNLLVVEPRGFGESGPLECPALNLEKYTTIRDCAALLGERVQFYTTDMAARDLEAVKQALGVGPVTFYGNSYGSLLAQAYVTRFPQQLRAVFLDSVVETETDGYAHASTLWTLVSDGMAMLGDLCQPSTACSAVGTDPEARWRELVDRLRDHPDQDVSFHNLIQIEGLLDEPVIGRDANAAAAAYLEGNLEPMHRLARMIEAVFGPEAQALQSRSFAALLAYQCGDGAFPFDRNAPPDQRLQQLDTFYATEEPFSPFTAQEVFDAFGIHAYPEWCANWPTPRASTPIPADAVYPNVPVLVVNGQLDTNTPTGGAAAVAARFPRATFLEIPFGTHGSSLGFDGPYSQCVRDMARAFLENPQYPFQNPGCSGETYAAVGTFPALAEDLPPAESAALSAAEKRLVAVAFATSADALSRRNPSGRIAFAISHERGLRGGQVVYNDNTRSVNLQNVRLVDDVTVSGDVHYADPAQATAILVLVDGDGRRYDVQLGWRAFQAVDIVEVSGSLSGRPFTATIPQF